MTGTNATTRACTHGTSTRYTVRQAERNEGKRKTKQRRRETKNKTEHADKKGAPPVPEKSGGFVGFTWFTSFTGVSTYLI